MPSEPNIKKLIPSLYKRDALSHMLFAWVNAVRYNYKGATIEFCVKQFQHYHGLSEDDFPTSSAVRKFHTMTKELHQLAKTKI